MYWVTGTVSNNPERDNCIVKLDPSDLIMPCGDGGRMLGVLLNGDEMDGDDTAKHTPTHIQKQ